MINSAIILVMAIIYNKTEEKTELQQKVLADLRAKQAASAPDGDTARLDADYDYDNRAGATDEIKTIRLWLVVAVMLITAVLVVVVNQK